MATSTQKKFKIHQVVNVNNLLSTTKFTFMWPGTIPVNHSYNILTLQNNDATLVPFRDDTDEKTWNYANFSNALKTDNMSVLEREIIKNLVDNKISQKYDYETNLIVDHLNANEVNKEITIRSIMYGWVDYIIVPISTIAGGAAPKPSKEKVILPGKSKPNIVYLGTRGGKYVKVNGKFVSLKKFK
jgi:hypothetical protein